MRFVFNDVEYDDKKIFTLFSDFTANCFFFETESFHKFINNTKFNDISLINWLKRIDENLKVENVEFQKNDKLFENLRDIVIEFFSTISTKLDTTVKSILENSNQNYKIEIVSTGKNRTQIHPKIDYIKILFNLSDDTLPFYIQIPHELSHAVSSFQTKSIEFTKKIKNEKDKDKKKSLQNKFDLFNKHIAKYEVKAINEIESFIVEKLYIKFLYDKNIITKEEFENYFKDRLAGVKHQLEEILEENEVLNHLNYRSTIDECKSYITHIHKTKDEKTFWYLIERIIWMSEEANDTNEYPICSQYLINYVLAEIVSRVWFDKYENSSDIEQSEMIKNFTKYLSNAYNLNLEKANTFLLNQDFAKIMEDFISIINKNNDLTLKNQLL